MADALANPIVIGLLIGTPASLLGYLGYRRSQKADQATESTDTIAQIIAGLNLLIDSLQADNAVLREQAIVCRNLVEVLRDRLEAEAAERNELRRTIAKLTGGAAMLLLLTALSVTSVTRDRLTEAHLVERASKVAKQEGKAAAKAEIKAQVDSKVEAEVAQQVGEKLYPNLYPTSTLPPAEQPIDRVDPNTADPGTVGDPAIPGPVDLTTTTTVEVPPDTTTTIIEVPTTVTIPDPPPLP